jgi:hypothetical protein
MTVRVYFHQHAPGPESDPRRSLRSPGPCPGRPRWPPPPSTNCCGGRPPGSGRPATGRSSRTARPGCCAECASPEIPASPTSGTSAGWFPTPPAATAAPRCWPSWTPRSGSSRRSSAPFAGRDGAAAVWAGRQLLVWGGHGRIPGARLRPLRDGAAYDPAGDRWQPLPTAPAGVQGTSAAAAWTGTRMLVWDGSSTDGRTTGAVYDPAGARRRRRRRIATGPPTARPRAPEPDRRRPRQARRGPKVAGPLTLPRRGRIGQSGSWGPRLTGR